MDRLALGKIPMILTSTERGENSYSSVGQVGTKAERIDNSYEISKHTKVPQVLKGLHRSPPIKSTKTTIRRTSEPESGEQDRTDSGT